MVLWPLSYGTNNEGSFRNEIEMVSLGWRRQQEPATDDHYRIGSDPPTVDGSLSAVDDFNEFASNNNNQHSAMSEQELKCVPDNWSYFHSDSILNRRLRSGDNNRVSEAENGYGKWFSSNNEVSEAEPPEKVQELKYWDKDGLHGLHGFSIADFRNEIAGTLQSHLDRSVPPPRHPSNLASRSSSNKNVDSAETILLASPNVASHDSVLGTGSLSRSTPKEFWIIEKLLAHLHVRHNQLGSRYVKTSFGSSSSENLKISGKYFFDELSEIAGFILNLSCHQEGSRFIQEKLETASIEEKIMIYKEIVPFARELFNHMYGNYVIQKMLEHGMRTQRRKLVSMLYGHVLTLSQAIYGCRVIQKAIEVADMDQKIVMIQELDGYIIECVRDQNGNHVIHKCIKCIPEKYIQFIVESFFDKVVFLSTHIYGCRVIQRVLGHCKDPWTQRKFIEEILGSVSMLAQDQHGNYVVQHVIVNGKPHERSAVIKELAGEIVELSQQKYASNVVEKCLCYGNAQEREILVNEMLVYTADYDPLQVMMKDQFANYVVQKALEVCNDQQMRRIVSRCLASSDVLKRYSYGKHIVSRVEKLSATGEW